MGAVTAPPGNLADTMPVAEGTASPGSQPLASRSNHVHPRLSATAKGVLDANGLATVVFTQVFDVEPAVTVISVGARAAGKTVPDFDITFTTDAGTGKFTGCTVFGQRSKPLPMLQQASGGLLGALVTSLNTVLAPLSGFSPIEPAAGAGFSLIAIKSTG